MRIVGTICCVLGDIAWFLGVIAMLAGIAASDYPARGAVLFGGVVALFAGFLLVWIAHKFARRLDLRSEGEKIEERIWKDMMF